MHNNLHIPQIWNQKINILAKLTSCPQIGAQPNYNFSPLNRSSSQGDSFYTYVKLGL